MKKLPRLYRIIALHSAVVHFVLLLQNGRSRCYVLLRRSVSLTLHFSLRKILWTLHQEGSALVGSQTLGLQSKEKVGLNPTFFFAIKTPQVGLEPTAYRLTAGCSAIELLRIIFIFPLEAEQLPKYL